MDDQASSILKSLQGLLPGVAVSARSGNWKAFTSEFPNLSGRDFGAGTSVSPEEAHLWFGRSTQEVYFFHVTRVHQRFTRAERDFLKYFRLSLAGLSVTSDVRYERTAMKVATRKAFEHIYISRFIRGGPTARTFWSPAVVVDLLQNLTFESYEGSPCTSGFVFTDALPGFVRNHLSEYILTRFDRPVELTDRYFEYPASFRYVDGSNSFYLVDNWRKVHGVLRPRPGITFTGGQRANYDNILSLISPTTAHAWVATAGENRDVTIAFTKNVLLRWRGGTWQVIDRRLLLENIRPQVQNDQIAGAIVSTAMLCSARRKGALMLLMNDDAEGPPVVGAIDPTTAGESLRAAVIGQSIVTLAEQGAAPGIVASDGLTTIARDGAVVSCGSIIDVMSAQTEQHTGGGRTQAAAAASHHGLAVKVSEDGQISLFRNGTRLFTFEL